MNFDNTKSVLSNMVESSALDDENIVKAIYQIPIFATYPPKMHLT